MSALPLKNISGQGDTIAPLGLVPNKDRFVDMGYDYKLQDGRYAYISVVWDPRGSNRVAVTRTKDVNYQGNLLVGEQYSAAYTGYITQPHNAKALKDEGLAVVLYHRNFALKHKEYDWAPAYGGKGIEIVPLSKFAKDHPEDLWSIYEKHLSAKPGKAYDSKDPQSLASLLNIHGWRTPPELLTIDRQIHKTISGYAGPDRPTKEKISTPIDSFNIANVNLNEEPEFSAIPIPYIPTDMEKKAYWQPGYTRIGYQTLLMPPEHIQYLREQPVESKQLMRAHGSNKKGYGHSSKQFQLMFHMEDGHTINGVLLPIIRQFMKTPFVPVENELLNDTYDVQALTLEALQISTVPGFPNALDVTLQASEFNWRAYMPGEYDLDSTYCYPLYKVWCENLDTTETRPIGWTNKSDYLAKLKTGTLPEPMMNGQFKMYLPDEEWLNELEELSSLTYDLPTALTLMGADAAKIDLARKFATEDGMRKILDEHGPEKSADVLNQDFISYERLTVEKNYNGDESKVKWDRDNTGTEFALLNKPAVAIKLTDRQFAKKLLLDLADAIESNKLTYEAHPEWTLGAPGYVPTPYTEVSGAMNPFHYGLFVTTDVDVPQVSQEHRVSRGSYVLKGKVWSANEIRNFVVSKLENVIAGGPSAAGEDVNSRLSNSYFVIPRDQVYKLGSLLDTYEDAKLTAANASQEIKDEIARRERQVPEDIEDQIAQDYWKEYTIPSFVVENVSVGSENLLALMQPQMQDSPSHQFLGRADAYVVVRGTITDQTDVNALRELLDKQEHLTRRYGGIQMAAPFSGGKNPGSGGYGGYMLLVNEICRLMGVTHAIPVKCNIITSKDFPGTFDVELVFTQFNLLQQEQSRPKMISEDEGWYASEDGPIDKDGTAAQKTTDTYFQHIIRAQNFHKKLRTLELYPDMILPSYEALLHWVWNLSTPANFDTFLRDKGIDPERFPWKPDTIVYNRRGDEKTCANLLKSCKFPKPYANDNAQTMRAYADPDFYCVPSFPTGKDFIEGVLETLSGSVNSKRTGKWTLADKPIAAETMNLRDRQRADGKLTFRGELAITGGNAARIKSIYDNIKVPERNSSGDITGYTDVAPEGILKEMKAAGFSKEQFTAIDAQAKNAGVPTGIAYNMFNYEKGAVDNRDPLREASYGIGQVQKPAMDQVNMEVAAGRIKSPWGNQKFTLADRSDPQKAAFMGSAYLRYYYDSITKKMGPGVDKKKAWAYASVCYVQHELLSWLDKDKGIDDAINRLPADDRNMKYGNKKHPNPIRPRFDAALTMIDVNTDDIQDPDIDDVPSPKIKETPVADKTAMVAGAQDTATDYVQAAYSDGRANYFLVGAHNGNHDSSGELFTANVYSPEITATGGTYGMGYMDFWQKHAGGRLEKRRLYFIPGSSAAGLMTPSTDSLDHLVDPNNPDIHYFIVRPGTSVGKDKKDYKDWVGYMRRQGINYADFQYLSGDPNGSTLWLKDGGKSTKSRPNEISGEVCTNIPDRGLENATGGPKSSSIMDIFYRPFNAEGTESGFPGRDMFYDMRRHSGFGRLLPAFPSYCVLIVDGGRWLRYWRLYDHLFGMTAVESIEVAKSRKTPTDVAAVTFSNMYGHLSKQPAESQQGKVFSWSLPMVIGAFQDSIMNTKRQDAEVLRRWKMHAKTLLLKPGARLHIRMGYGSNAAKLPAVFNGVISEVTPGADSLDVVALGDGIELEKKLQPNASNSDGNTIYRSHSLFGAATTPREAVLGVMAPTRFIELVTTGGYDHNNPHGIEHFGSPTYHFMRKEANEVGMNIYEATSAALERDSAVAGSNAFLGAVKGLNIVPGYGMIDGNYNNFLFGLSMEDATAWDVFTTCRRAIPEYICAVHPFGLRSTLFFGKSHWPLRFDYADTAVSHYQGLKGNVSFLTEAEQEVDKDGKKTGYLSLKGFSEDEELDLDEVTMWKPYAQMRVISSTFNLISNQIKASDEDVYTICQAVGSHNGLFTPDAQNNDWSDKVFLDTDIYPEHQKMLYVKSGLYSTGTMKFLDALRSMNTADLIFTRKAGNTYAINAMRDTVMDMYKGSVVIVGDPSIKPHDITFFADTRAEMSGLFRVKEVTHHLSADTGLVTTVSPDLVCSMVDFAEQTTWSWLHQFGHRFSGALGLQYMIGSVAAKRANPIMLLTKLSTRIRNFTDEKAPWANEALDEVEKLLNKIRTEASGQLDDLGNFLVKPGTTKKVNELTDAITGTIGDLNRLIGEFDDKGHVARRLTKPLIQKLETTRDVWKIEQEAADVSKVIAEALKAEKWEEVREALSRLKKLQVVKALGKRGALATTAARLGKLSVYMVAVDSLLEWVNRKFAYRQCLVLRPLMLNSREFSAGINGHLGCVVGDPDGYWDGVIQSLTNWNYNKTHQNGVYYGYNGDQQATQDFGDMALGLVSVFAAAAGVQPVDYGGMSGDDIDKHIFGEGTMSDPEVDLHYQRIREHMHRVFSGDIDGIEGGAERSGIDDMDPAYRGGAGSGFNRLLEEQVKGDYGPNHCNVYAYDVMVANGWVGPKRKPGTNTGTNGSVNINSLKTNRKYMDYIVEAPITMDDIKPGMLVRFKKQHWAVVTEDYKLNENLTGVIEPPKRKVKDHLSELAWVGMPKYQR